MSTDPVRRSESNPMATSGPGPHLPIGQCAALASLLEVMAPKPGNVHRGADFEDLYLQDFAMSGVRIAPAMERAAEIGVGQAVFQAIRDTRTLVNTNTNLGIVLLIAPLAAVPREVPLAGGISEVLRDLDSQDARLVYEAIQLASSGALGEVPEMDVSGTPPPDLLTAMQLARDRDLIARQYVEDFSIVLQQVGPWILQPVRQGFSLTQSIVHAFLTLMASYPDSLIARKGGPREAQEASDRAAEVLEQGGPGDEPYHEALGELDFWLRSAGSRRNPGTSADLIAAGLFALLRDGQLVPPFR
jgi:triphosphoribosyl-dephospho-CoA synthase